MKDSFFELLFHFFEKTIAELKAQQLAPQVPPVESCVLPETRQRLVRVQVEQLKAAQDCSVRVFTNHERYKLTKASYQFLVRMASWGIISSETLELIINRLVFSNSRFVSLQETKWAIRNTLAHGLTFEQAAFLDLILYQKEDQLSLH